MSDYAGRSAEDWYVTAQCEAQLAEDRAATIATLTHRAEAAEAKLRHRAEAAEAECERLRADDHVRRALSDDRLYQEACKAGFRFQQQAAKFHRRAQEAERLVRVAMSVGKSAVEGMRENIRGLRIEADLWHERYRAAAEQLVAGGVPDHSSDGDQRTRMRRLDVLIDRALAERNEARNARDHYMDVWNEQCAHVREACEMLGVDPEQIAADSWTLRDYAARVYRWWIDAERADSGKAHRLAALGGELFAARERAEQADTTRREWEVRAATSYADGRKAGLREAAAKLAELRDEWEVMMGDGSVAHNCGKIAHGHVIALAQPAAETRDEGEVSDE